MTDQKEFIDFLKELKDNINMGKSRNDLKTIINKKIKSINSMSVGERQPVSNNEQKEELCNCRNSSDEWYDDWDVLRCWDCNKPLA